MDTRLVLPANLQPLVDETIAAAVGGRWASRIWARDASLWTDDADIASAIAGGLGWLDAPSSFGDAVAELMAFAAEIEREGFTDVLLAGMGAASRATEVLTRVYPESDKGLRMHVLASTDPEAVAAFDTSLDPASTLRIIATRNGDTTETLAFLAHLFEREQHRVGRFPHSKAGNAFVSITGPGRVVDALPQSKYFRETFLDIADIGERFSALSYFGLVPAALLRLDLALLLEDASIMAETTRLDADDNAALVLGAAMAALAKAGRDKLTLVIEPDLAGLGPWLEQLIAGATGKQGVGIVPVSGEALGAPEVYGDDRVFLRLGPENDSEWHADVDARLAALTQAGHPLIDIRLDDASWVAAEFFRWEFAVAVAGVALGVNPFDAPNVIESKRNTARLLDSYGREHTLPHIEPAAVLGDLRIYTQTDASGSPRDPGDFLAALRGHVARAAQAGYLHIGAYIAPTPERTQALGTLQSRLRESTHRATMVEYGPDFLHGSGQLHKGGTPSGCFIQLTARHPQDVPIPDRRETFGTLIDAQAMGDLEALTSHDLPALRIDLGADVEAGLAALAKAVDEALG